MPVTLTNTRVKTLSVDYESQAVTVSYIFTDTNGKGWGDTSTVIFFVTMPPEPPEGYPPEWFQLPAGYIPTFVSLQTDAENAITNKFLG